MRAARAIAPPRRGKRSKPAGRIRNISSESVFAGQVVLTVVAPHIVVLVRVVKVVKMAGKLVAFVSESRSDGREKRRGWSSSR